MKRYLYVILLPLVMLSCERIAPDGNEDVRDIRVVDGHLHFRNSGVLDEYLANYSDGYTDLATRSADMILGIPGFTSLAQRRFELVTKGGESEEMSEYEYRIHCAEELLIDPILAHVVDTSMVIGVGDKIYKVTEKGTFEMDAENSLSHLSGIIDGFEPVYSDWVDVGEPIVISDGVRFIDTFSSQSHDCFVRSYEDDVDTKAIAPGVNFHGRYDVETYKWANDNGFERFFDRIKGKEVARFAELDSKHRVKVSLFNVNYQFYKSSGLTVKFQQKKKFLGVSVWTSCKPHDVIVGFNYMGGEYTLLTAQSFSMFSGTGFGSFRNFNMAVDDTVNPMIAGVISDIPFISNFTEKMAFCIPQVVRDITRMSQVDMVNALYSASSAGISAGLKAGLRLAYDVDEDKSIPITETDPKMALTVWGKSISKFTREKPIISGVETYNANPTKTVRFDLSYGISLSFGTGGFGMKPMAVSQFKIDEVDAFGAVKYNGKYKGVRFVGTKAIK